MIPEPIIFLRKRSKWTSFFSFQIEKLEIEPDQLGLCPKSLVNSTIGTITGTHLKIRIEYCAFDFSDKILRQNYLKCLFFVLKTFKKEN